MKHLLFITLSFFLGTFQLLAQNPAPKTEPGAKQDAAEAKKAPLFGIHFSGYVNTDIFFDTRQTVMAREGQWLFYPEKMKLDPDGKDINAKGTYNILSIQTRVSGNITGPDIFNAKTSGLIEGEFYGNINVNINSFRLRHAFVKLNWAKTELLLGQTWHPLYVPACTPEPVSLNAGAPFVIFTRNPQVRVTRQLGNFKLLLAAVSQVDATSTGPDGPSPKYLRNSIVPELAFQVQYGLINAERKTEFMIGASVDYLMLTPRLGTKVVVRPAYDSVKNNVVVHADAVIVNYKTTAKSTALTANFFAKLKLPKITMKVGGVYGENCYAFNMIGGYAVKSVTDPLKGIVDYAPIRTASIWGEFKTNGPKWSAGIYAAYSKNFGAGTGLCYVKNADLFQVLPIAGSVPANIAEPFYSRGANIDYLYRVAPRLVLTVSKLKIAGELDYTVAAYGKITDKGLVSDSKEIGNLRILLGVYYYF
ncbi:MAG: hypothetical protein NT040_05965 [Bacteroidetes bacterium]|nr:hypothetical protein [Bacteroidota bacterium]